jgi:hypothetical protein
VKPVAGREPFENQDFDSLLASLDRDLSAEDEADPDAATDGQPPPGPLAPLADLGRIENPGLRAMLAERSSQSSLARSQGLVPSPDPRP